MKLELSGTLNTSCPSLSICMIERITFDGCRTESTDARNESKNETTKKTYFPCNINAVIILYPSTEPQQLAFFTFNPIGIRLIWILVHSMAGWVRSLACAISSCVCRTGKWISDVAREWVNAGQECILRANTPTVLFFLTTTAVFIICKWQQFLFHRFHSDCSMCCAPISCANWKDSEIFLFTYSA